MTNTIDDEKHHFSSVFKQRLGITLLYMSMCPKNVCDFRTDKEENWETMKALTSFSHTFGDYKSAVSIA